jgi:hypothetical protein
MPHNVEYAFSFQQSEDKMVYNAEIMQPFDSSDKI